MALGDVVPGGRSDLAGRRWGPSWSCTSSRAATSSTADAAVRLASGIWPHGRYRFDFTGAANHAGTTRMADRADPMLTYAMTVLAANKQARLAGQRATFGRVVGRAQRDQRRPLAGHGVARRALLVGRTRWPRWSRRWSGRRRTGRRGTARRWR